MPRFSIEETEKMIRFFDRIVNAKGDFRINVLNAMEEIFGYKNCTFWRSRDDGMLIDPRYIHIDNKVMYAWADHYYQYDPFFASLVKLISGSLVLSDVANEKKYFMNNVYYHDILAPFGYPYKMVLGLISGNKLLGGMSFLRRKEDGPFTKHDKEIIDYLSHFISQLYIDRKNIETVLSENSQLIQFADLSGDGLIIADEKSSIHYMNPGAKTIFENLLDKKEITSIDDLLCGVRYQSQNTVGSNHFSYCEMIGYGIHTGVKMVNGNKFYDIIFNHLHETPTLFEQRTINDISLPKDLTDREKEVLQCLMQGMTNSQIAKKLFISLQTVKMHLYNIYRKYHVHNRTSLLAKTNKK